MNNNNNKNNTDHNNVDVNVDAKALTISRLQKTTIDDLSLRQSAVYNVLQGLIAKVDGLQGLTKKFDDLQALTTKVNDLRAQIEYGNMFDHHGRLDDLKNQGKLNQIREGGERAAHTHLSPGFVVDHLQAQAVQAQECLAQTQGELAQTQLQLEHTRRELADVHQLQQQAANIDPSL